MVQVLLKYCDDGILQSCSAQGHAGHASKGFDIVCAAISSLLRTSVAVLENRKSCVLEIKSSDRGQLAFSVTNYSSSDIELLKYSFQFLQFGLLQIEKEYPECVELRVQNCNKFAEA